MLRILGSQWGAVWIQLTVVGIGDALLGLDPCYRMQDQALRVTREIPLTLFPSFLQKLYIFVNGFLLLQLFKVAFIFIWLMAMYVLSRRDKPFRETDRVCIKVVSESLSAASYCCCPSLSK